MALVVESGDFAGELIHRARKEHWCSGHRGRNARGHRTINIGDYYIGGYWGSYAFYYCLDCVPEAKERIAQQEEVDAKLAEIGRTIKRLGQEIKAAKRKQPKLTKQETV